MINLRSFFKLLVNNKRGFASAVISKMGFLFSDEPYLKMLFGLKMGYKLNLKTPKTFSEKLQWLKLYYRKPEQTMMVDKYAVKNYVASIIGSQYVIPTLGVWNTPEEIEWDKLPNQFVLKTTHGGGSSGVVICRDKSSFNRKEAFQKLCRGMKHNIYNNLREWPYKNVPHRVLAEKYIAPTNIKDDIPDYKFFCFDGKVNFYKIDFDRNIFHRANYYDCEGNLLPFGESSYPRDPKRKVEIPQNISKMIFLAEKLSAGFPFVRIDLYNVNGCIYFGEITFYPAGGMGQLEPKEWDEYIGNMINIEKIQS